jgi:hypothetical protein
MLLPLRDQVMVGTFCENRMIGIDQLVLTNDGVNGLDTGGAGFGIAGQYFGKFRI